MQVAGAVHVPGVYSCAAGSRVFEAVAQAGGFADDADQQAVALAAELSDGCRVYVPKVGEMAGGYGGRSRRCRRRASGRRRRRVGQAVRCRSTRRRPSNSTRCPASGRRLAQQIIAYRRGAGTLHLHRPAD